MSPTLLRHLWSLVEGANSTILLTLDDQHLVQWLLDQLSGQRSIDKTEADHLGRYIHSRVSLIRDIAQSR